LEKENLPENIPYRRDTNILTFNFNNGDFYIRGIRGYNAIERMDKLSDRLKQEILPYHSGTIDKEENYGAFKFKIQDKNTLEIAKKIIGIQYDNLKEELESRNKNYYLKKG
jgi:hypothetical protein